MRDAVVVLSKGSLKTITPQRLRHLKRQNIAIVADWVDSRVRHELLGGIDVMLACSINAFAVMAKDFPKHKVVYLAHHVDPRIRPGCAADRFSVGYFGNRKNAFITPEIERFIHFSPVNTKTSETAWMNDLAHHSMHYSVRPGVERSGLFKPFTKGFIAAHCGANILVDLDESDAFHILGEDYPFMLRSRRESEVLEKLAFARESFGGPDWRRGLEMMADCRRFCDPDYIARQFAGMLKDMLR